MKQKYDEKMLEEVQQSYRDGKKVVEIAQTYGVKPVTVYKWLKIKLPNKQTSEKEELANVTKEDVERIYKETSSISKTAQHTGVSQEMVKKILKIERTKEEKLNHSYKDGKTIVKYQRVMLDGKETIRVTHADGTYYFNRKFKNQLSNLNRQMEEDGKRFIEQNSIENLNSKDQRRYAVISDFFSEEHENTSVALSRSQSLQKNRELAYLLIAIYNNYNDYTNLSQKELKQLKEIIHYYLQQDKEKEVIDKNLFYDYDFYINNKKTKEYDLVQLMQYQKEGKNWKYDAISDSFTPRKFISNLTLTADTYRYLKQDYILKRDKAFVEHQMFSLSDSPRLNIKKLDLVQLRSFIQWNTNYLNHGTNELYKKIILSNRILMEDIQFLKERDFQIRYSRLKTIQELVKEENAKKKTLTK